MRRTLFIEPTELAPIVHVALRPVDRARASDAGSRAGSSTPASPTTPGPWLAGVEDATVAAIERLGSGTAAELTKVVPELAIQIPVSIGKTYQGTVGVSTRVLFLLAMDGRISRGRPRGTWVSSQYRWEPMHRWVDMEARSADVHGGIGPGRAGGALAARLRPRHDRRPALVDRLDARRRPPGARVARHRRGRPRRRHDRPGHGRRPRDRRGRARALDRAPPLPRPDDDGLDGRATGISGRTARPCSIGTAMPARRSGSTAASSAAGASARTARSSPACSRTSVRRPRPRSRHGPPRSPRWMDGVRIMPRFPTPLQRELSA